MSKHAPVTLRAVEVDDAKLIHEWYSDESFRTISGGRYPASVQRWREWAERYKEPEYGNAVFGVCAAGADELIGIGSLRNRSIEDRSAEIAIMIGRQEHRQRGFGVSATIELLRFGFEVMGLHRVYSRILTYNTAGVALAKACGAVHEGTARQARFVRGKYRDIEQYAVLAHEFRGGAF